MLKRVVVGLSVGSALLATGCASHGSPSVQATSSSGQSLKSAAMGTGGRATHPTVTARVATVAPDAKGVNQGTKKQATKIKMVKPPVQSGAQVPPTAGCTAGYGRGVVCLPITPPSAGQMGMTVKQMPWTCSEVRLYFPQGVLLTKKGVDPARLDGNKDGVACGKGDV